MRIKLTSSPLSVGPGVRRLAVVQAFRDSTLVNYLQPAESAFFNVSNPAPRPTTWPSQQLTLAGIATLNKPNSCDPGQLHADRYLPQACQGNQLPKGCQIGNSGQTQPLRWPHALSGGRAAYVVEGCFSRLEVFDLTLTDIPECLYNSKPPYTRTN